MAAAAVISELPRWHIIVEAIAPVLWHLTPGRGHCAGATRRRTRLDDDGGRDSCRCPHGRGWPPCSGGFAAAVGIWSPCRIRGCDRRRAPAPRSGDALDCRRPSGAEERGFADSDGALRDAMARGARELRFSCRPVWPVDRPCARPKATRGIVLDMDFKREPDPRRAGE